MAALDMSMLSEEDALSLSSTMLPSEITSRIRVMQRQESTTYKCEDYIGNDTKNCSATSSVPQGSQDRPVDRDCRVKMCQWCYQVADFCKFRRETVAISMSYLDRFLSTPHPRARLAARYRKEYQLAAMTSLYTAVKLFEPLEMDASLMSDISRGCYTEKEIVEMEKDILDAISWRVNGPTAHDFLSHFTALLPSTYKGDSAVAMSLLDFSRFQAEIAVCDYELALQKPSVIAMAALLNSVEGIDEGIFSAKARFGFLRSITDASGMNPFASEIQAARVRLLKLFFNNSGYELPQIANLTPIVSTEDEFTTRTTKQVQVNSSPVSITGTNKRRGSFAKCA